MKHAKRMVVISEDEYRKLKGSIKSRQTVTDYKKRISSQIQRRLSQKKHPSIDSYFDPKYQNKVRALMAELIASGVTINSKNELQLAHGDTVPNSNIIELMRELLVGATTSRDNVEGWNEFLNAIARTDVPLSIFPKNAVKNALRRIRWEEY